MPQTSVTNAGVPAGPSHSDNVYLEVFSGEVLKSFNVKTVWEGRHRVRTIASGKSAQFPAIGKAAAEYHQPGRVILGQDVNAGEQIIVVDDLLISSVFMSNFEEAMTHYETRGEYAVQIADSLAQAYDQHLFAIAAKACAAGATGPVAEMGAATRDAIGAAPTTANIIDAIYAGAAHFDETNVPQDGRVAFIKPSIWWNLIQDGKVIDRDFGNGGANQNRGGKLWLANFELLPSNNMSLNFGTDTLSGSQAGAVSTDYDHNNTEGLVMLAQKQALGTVSLMSLATEKDYQVERQGTLMVVRKACGHGVLRPECLRNIVAAAS